jgi:hypothetical protein
MEAAPRSQPSFIVEHGMVNEGLTGLDMRPKSTAGQYSTHMWTCSCIHCFTSDLALIAVRPPTQQVTTYHISTLSTTQRAAATTQQAQPQQHVSSGRSSGSSTGTDQSQPDLLETYIVMEFCPRGSLERALKQGRFRRHDGQPDMVRQRSSLDVHLWESTVLCGVWPETG